VDCGQFLSLVRCPLSRTGGYAAQSGWPHWHSGSGVPAISISAQRSLQNFLFPRSTSTSSQRQPRWSHFISCGIAG